MSTDVVSATAPLACIPGAIPAAKRAAHFARARRLFATAAREARPIASGRAYRFEADELLDVAGWITLERRCCPFLSFAIELGSDGALWLRLTGPEGTPEFLDVELSPAATTHDH